MRDRLAVHDSFAVDLERRKCGVRIAAIIATACECDEFSRMRNDVQNRLRERRTGRAHECDVAHPRDRGCIGDSHLLGGNDPHQSLSRITTAEAIVAVCVIVRWIRDTLRLAGKWAYGSRKSKIGFPLRS